MSLLTIIQTAADRIGFVTPTSGVGSSDETSKQLVGLAGQEVAELARAHPWQALVKEKTFTATATEEQADAVPEDFDRFIPNTMYNRSRLRIVAGPLTAQEWQDLKGRSAVVVYDAFRQRGNALLFQPVPTAGQVYAYEYISKYPVVSQDGATFRRTFADDNDAPLLDDELVTLGVMWRFLRAKGLDYSEAFRSYELMKKQLMARDGGQRGVNLAKNADPLSPRYPLVPDSNWNIS